MSTRVMTSMFTHPDGRVFRAELGRVGSTMLGIEEYGVLTAFLNMDFAGSGQGAGGYALDGKPHPHGGDRTPHAACGAFIVAVLGVAGVSKWEELIGVQLFVLREQSYGSIVGIAQAIDPSEFLIFKDLTEAL